MPISAPIVTTPVPPMPVTRMFHGWSRSVANPGCGNVEKSTLPGPPLRFFSPPPWMVTKLGQKPLTQE